MNSQRILFFLFFPVLFFGSCMSSPYYQKSITIPGNEWSYKFQPSFKFEIKDTAALYDLYFIIRHTEAYPYSNIWLKVKTKLPGDTLFEESHVEIPLAEKSGKWLGKGMGEIWEQRLILGTKWTFKNPGMCEIKLEQNMRIDPLPDVLNVGIRVEHLGHKINSPQQ